jgi:formate dehydrogenase iron-sulfur subunit
MGISRRNFFGRVASIAGTAILGRSTTAHALNTANERNWNLFYKKLPPVSEERYGVLVDTTVCIGCRRCEWACNEWNNNPNRPIEEFEGSVNGKNSVFDAVRRMHAENFTVVNRFISPKDGNPIYVKRQCMHCEDPGCLSSCFVDAYRKTKMGPVLYGQGLCVGCRYCMVACPFDVPAYEYNEPLNPQITKCTFCFDRITKGSVPACVEICPAQVMTFGKRTDLLNLAHKRIIDNPGKYVDHVYGEHEVGGTSWMYLSSVPFDQIGFKTTLPETPIPNLSKAYLFGVKMFEVVGAWPLVFGAYYAISKARKKTNESHETSSEQKGEDHGAKH